jgi:CheY-like chemotaxis protein
MLFVRHAPEAISYLNGEGRFADRKCYPLPEILVLDLTKPRMNAWEVLDWLKAQPDLNRIHVCFIGSEADAASASKAKAHGPCFFTRPPDVDSYIELVAALEAISGQAVEQAPPTTHHHTH